jgi:hypothetical protein
MELTTIVKLKDNYLFFNEGNMMCIYDMDDSLVKLKFACKDIIDTYTLKRELSKPHTIHWLKKQSYFSWLGVLMSRYSDMFEVVEADTLQWERMKNNLTEIISRESYAENAELSVDFSHSTLVLYGLSKTNVMIVEAVRDMNYKNIILINRDELVEADDIEDETGIYSYQDLLKTKKDILTDYYRERSHKINLLEQQELESLAAVDKSIFIIENDGLSKEELLRINLFITEHKKLAIFFQMHQEELIFGPLVVGGESTCLECLEHSGHYEKYYGVKSIPIDSVFRYMLLFLIKRTLCYVKENDLFILLGDVQIPINKIFKINRLNMRGEFDYIYRDIKCSCSAAI